MQSIKVLVNSLLKKVYTRKSITGGGDLTNNIFLELVNDEETPGADKVYGTNSEGVKVWKADPSDASVLQQAQAYTDEEISIAVFGSSYGIIWPEFYGAAGDGSTDDATDLAEWIATLSGGANKLIGIMRRAVYMTSAKLTLSNTPQIKGFGTIKRTPASTADTIVQASLGSAGITSIELNVDGNSANANYVVGILMDSGSNNTKSDHSFSAVECDIGVKQTGNVEKVSAKLFARSNVVGLNINNDGSANTPDEVYWDYCGSDNDTFLLADGTEKISYIVFFKACEQGDDNTKYAIDHQNGVGKILGGIRGVHGGVKLSTNSALKFTFSNFLLYGKGAGSALYAILSDAPNCQIKGDVDFYEWEEGMWFKRCAAGSELNGGKRDSGTTGTGLRIGDFASGYQTGFRYSGTLFGATYNLHLDYSTGSYIDIYNTIDAGGILISANSSKNTILIPLNSRTKVITNNRVENDNRICYKGTYTNAELEQIPSPFKGMVVEASDDPIAFGSLFWNGTKWQDQTGLEYNTASNTWE